MVGQLFIMTGLGAIMCFLGDAADDEMLIRIGMGWMFVGCAAVVWFC